MLRTELKKSPRGSVLLLLIDAENYTKINTLLLDVLINEQKLPGIYVTVNRPYTTLIRTLADKDIDTSRIFFIDMISQTVGEKFRDDYKNCVFISSPESLTELAIALGQAVQAIPEKNKFIFFDTLSTLLIYNHVGTVSKFIHFFSSKIRVWGVEGIILSLEKETDERLLSQLTQFSDDVLEIVSENSGESNSSNPGEKNEEKNKEKNAEGIIRTT